MNEPKKENSLMDKGQLKLPGVALSAISLFALFLMAGWTIRSLGHFTSYFASVIWPLAIAAILAILLAPFVRSIERRSRLSRNSSILLLYLCVLIVCGLAIWGIGGELVRQIRELAGSSTEWPQRVEDRVRESISPETWDAMKGTYEDFKQNWKQALESIGSNSSQWTEGSARALRDAWSGLGSFFAFFACVAIIPVYLFYFLGSHRDHLADLVGQLNFLSPEVRRDLVFLIAQFKQIIEAFFRGQLMVGAMMGLCYAFGFSISGLKFGIALGLIFGILNVVPFLGSIIGCAGAAIVAYLQPGGILESGEWGILWGSAITFVLVQILESYWLSPKVMGNRTGLHPVVIIASVFFWGTAFGGILGMILGIPLTAFLIVLWRLLRQKYFPS